LRYILIGFDSLQQRIGIYLNAKDEKCDDNFVWCEKQEQKRFVGPEYPWHDLEPDDLTGAEICILMIKTNSTFFLTDLSCLARNRFICEVFATFIHNRLLYDCFFFINCTFRAKKHTSWKSNNFFGSVIDMIVIICLLYTTASIRNFKNPPLLLKSSLNARRGTDARYYDLRIHSIKYFTSDEN